MRASTLALLILAPALASAETFTNSKGVSIEGEIVTADISAGEVTVLVEKYRKEIAASFNVFVIGDGGVRNGDWQRKLFKGHHIYLCWGETSDNKDMTIITADTAESANMIVARSEMKDTGHKFTPEEKEKVKAWLLGTVMPARQSDAAGE